MSTNSQELEPKKIKVQLLLAGGHQYTVYINADDPVLHNLLTTIVARAYKQESANHCLFQIPVNEGHSALCFASENLVGLVTEPPLWIQQTNDFQQHVSNDILNSNYVQIDNFFSPQEHDRLIKYVLANKSQFVSTTTSTNDDSYRRSRVLYSFPEFSEIIVNKIQKIMPDVMSKLGMSPFVVSQIESQLTAHNDGNFYKIHNDNGSPDTATRELTYVYYFNREPKRFSGGELVLYDSEIKNSFYVKAESFKTIEPRNNSIVFFFSRYMHEVLPVKCPSQSFADSRFTINGWVRRETT